MSDVLQFKDLVGRSTVQSGVQPLQRKGDALADPLIQPIQAPIQRLPERGETKPVPKSGEAKGADPKTAEPAQAKAEPAETEPVQAKAEPLEAIVEAAPAQAKDLKTAPIPTVNPVQMKAEPAPEPVEAEPEAAVEEKPAVKAPNQIQGSAPAPAALSEEEPAEVEAKVNEAKLELGGGDGPGDADPIGGGGGGDPIQAKGGGDGAIPTAPRGGGAPAPSAPPPTPPSAPAPAPAPPPAPPSAPAPTPSASAPSAPAPASSSGSPLPEGLKGKMEASFGKDLSDVSIREDSSAPQIGAQAYTQGKTITVAPGKLDTTSKSGQELIGHEIAHTEQQAAGVVKADSQAKGGQALNTDQGLEAEADRAGAAAAAGQPAVVSGAGAGTQLKADTGPIQRKGENDVVTDAPIDWAKLKTSAGTDKAFLEQSAVKIGDKVASKKLEEVANESVPEALAVRDLFYADAAATWLALPKKDAENALYSMLKDVVTKNKWKGLAVSKNIQDDGHEVHRAIGAGGFFGYNISMDAKKRIQTTHFAEQKQANKPVPELVGAPPLSGDGKSTEWDKLVFARWLDDCKKNRELDLASLSGQLQEAGWWTPDDQLKLLPTTAPPPDETFALICKVLSLKPEWYAPGFITVSVPDLVTQWLRPTAFDGMMSPLWKQHPDDVMAKAGGGAVEVLNKDKVDATKVTRATAHIVSDELNQELQNAGDSHHWVNNPQDTQNTKVGNMQKEVMTEMGGPQQLEAEKDWEPSMNSRDKAYWEGEKFQAPDGKAPNAPVVAAFVSMDMNIGNYRKKGGTLDDHSKVPAGTADRVSGLMEKEANTDFQAQIASNGFNATRLTTNVSAWTDKAVAKLNWQLFPEKVRISVVNLYLSKDAERDTLRAGRDEMNVQVEGKRNAETDRYWIKSGKKPPSVSQEEWDKVLAAHKQGEQTETPVPVEPPKVEKQHDPDATPIPFVTDKFKVKDKAISRDPFDIVLSGKVFTKSKKEAEAGAGNIALLNQVKARRAVSGVLPSLVEQKIGGMGFDKATAPKEIEKLAKVAKVMSQYEAEQYELEIDEIEFEVLRGEAATTALKAAQEEGHVAKPQGPEVNVDIQVTEDSIKGTISVPFLNIGGGIICRGLSGSGEWNRKANTLSWFKGSGTAVVPLGSAQVVEVTFENVEIRKTLFSSAKNPTYVLEQGKGTFTARMPIKIFEKNGYKFSIDENASGSVELKKGEIENIHGKVDFIVEDAEDKVFKLALDGNFAVDSTGTVKKPLEGTANAVLLKDRILGSGMGPDKTWTAILAKGTTADAVVSKGVLTKISGELLGRIDDGKDPWVEITGRGDYDHPAAKVNFPDASIKVVKTTVVGRSGDKEFWLKEGTNAAIAVKDNVVTKVSGKLDGLVKVAGKDKIGAKLEGKWTPDGGLDGSGEVKTLDDFTAEVAGGSIKLHAGAAGSAVIKAGDLQSIDAKAKADFLNTFAGQPLDIQLEGSAKFDWPSKTLVAANGAGKLLKPLNIGEHVRLDTLEGDFAVVNNELVSASGKMAAVFHDEKGDLVGGSVKGTWTKEANAIDGTAQVDLRRDLSVEMGGGMRATVAKGAIVGASVVKNEITEIWGGLSVGLFRGEKKVATLIATDARYDVKSSVLKSLKATATLDEKFEFFDGKLSITEARASIEIVDNQLVKAAGKAAISAPVINIPKAVVEFTWRNDGKRDWYSVKGSVKWVLFKQKDRHLGGQLDIDYKEDGTFTAHALVDYQMSKGFGAKGDLTIDNTLIPKINKIEIGVDTKLSDAMKLFEFETTIIKLPLRFLIFQLALAIDVGSSLKMRPITLAGKFAVENWSPGTEEESQTPDFSATIGMGLGFDFELWLAASLEAAIDVFVAAVGIGAEAKLILKVPIDVNPTLSLKGGKKGWSGAFGIDLAITPKLLLELSTYLFADIVFFDPWEYEMAKWDFDLAELPGLKWKETFPFGESDEPPPAPKPEKKAPSVAVPPPESKKKIVKKKANEIAQPAEKKKAEAKSATLPGGKQLSGDSLLGDQQKGAGAGSQNKSGEGTSKNQLGLIMDAAKGLQSIDVFIKFIKDCAVYLITAGPILGPLMIAWDVFTGKIDLNKLKAAWQDFVNGIKAAGELLKGMSDNPFSFTYRMGRWMKGEISTWDLIMEGDNEIVTFVNEKKHKAPTMKADHFNSMLQVLCGWDNSCGPTEQACVIEIMREAGKKGMLHQALIGLKGSMYINADQVLWKCEGVYDDQAREIFRQYGVVPGEEFLNAAKEKYGPVYWGMRQKLPSWTDRLTADAIYDKSGKEAAIKWVNTKIPK